MRKLDLKKKYSRSSKKRGKQLEKEMEELNDTDNL